MVTAIYPGTFDPVHNGHVDVAGRASKLFDKLIIGICNGFQILSNLGLVPATDLKFGERQAALMHNRTARFECHWIHLKNNSNK